MPAETPDFIPLGNAVAHVAGGRAASVFVAVARHRSANPTTWPAVGDLLDSLSLPADRMDALLDAIDELVRLEMLAVDEGAHRRDTQYHVSLPDGVDRFARGVVSPVDLASDDSGNSYGELAPVARVIHHNMNSRPRSHFTAVCRHFSANAEWPTIEHLATEFGYQKDTMFLLHEQIEGLAYSGLVEIEGDTGRHKPGDRVSIPPGVKTLAGGVLAAHGLPPLATLFG